MLRLHWAALLEHLMGENGAMSSFGVLPWISSDITTAVIGARRMPLRKCPVAMYVPGSDPGPKMGNPSGDPGRNPVHASMIFACPIAGTMRAAA